MSTGLEYLLSSLNQTQPTIPFHYCFSPPFIMPLSSLAPPPVDPLAFLSWLFDCVHVPRSHTARNPTEESERDGIGRRLRLCIELSAPFPLYPPASREACRRDWRRNGTGGSNSSGGTCSRPLQGGVAARQGGEVVKWEEHGGSTKWILYVCSRKYWFVIFRLIGS